MLIQVRDQGVGIDGGNLDRIFDPFFTTKENGTGLGLAVAHRIVSHHGGRIEVESNVDKGMRFQCFYRSDTRRRFASKKRVRPDLPKGHKRRRVRLSR